MSNPTQNDLNEDAYRALFNGFEPHSIPSSTSAPSDSEEEYYLLLPNRSVSIWQKEIFNILLIERVGKSNVVSSRPGSDEIGFWRVPTRCLREDQFAENPVILGMAVDEKMTLEL